MLERRFIAAFAVLVIGLVGCAKLGVVSDGSSIARDRSNGGTLLNPVELPTRGDGYWIPRRWVHRGSRYGTEELVSLVVHAGRMMASSYPGEPFGVADLSPERGGPSIWHRSHQNGLDVDLLFYATDSRGRHVPLGDMPHFRDDGTAWLAGGDSGRRIEFDLARNWQLVRTILLNPIAEVQYIFIYDPLRQQLLDYATHAGEPWMTVLFASYVMRQPAHSSPHDDHMHVRLYCPISDRVSGNCRDYGELRRSKGDGKYPRARALARLEPIGVVGPMPVWWAAGTVPMPISAYVAD